MEVITYTDLDKLNEKAKELGKEVHDTNYCYSFRIFEQGKCTEFHVFKK